MPSSYAIDPELAAALPQLSETDLDDVVGARRTQRQALAALPAPDPTGVSFTDTSATGPEGASHVPVRVYLPDGLSGPSVSWTCMAEAS